MVKERLHVGATRHPLAQFEMRNLPITNRTDHGLKGIMISWFANSKGLKVWKVPNSVQKVSIRRHIHIK